MAEAYQRQSPLAHLHLAAGSVVGAPAPAKAGVTLREHVHRTMITMRGDATDDAFRSAVEKTTGVAPPTKALSVARKGKRAILWMGPDEWLVVAPAEERESLPGKLTDALAALHGAAVEVGESMTVIALAGPRARDVLAKGCTIDLHPGAFGADSVVRTLLAKTGVILHRTSVAPSPQAPTYEVYVHRSFADYAWRWLEDASLEYGVAIAGG